MVLDRVIEADLFFRFVPEPGIDFDCPFIVDIADAPFCVFDASIGCWPPFIPGIVDPAPRFSPIPAGVPIAPGMPAAPPGIPGIPPPGPPGMPKPPINPERPDNAPVRELPIAEEVPEVRPAMAEAPLFTPGCALDAGRIGVLKLLLPVN